MKKDNINKKDYITHLRYICNGFLEATKEAKKYEHLLYLCEDHPELHEEVEKIVSRFCLKHEAYYYKNTEKTEDNL